MMEAVKWDKSMSKPAATIGDYTDKRVVQEMLADLRAGTRRVMICDHGRILRLTWNTETKQIEVRLP